MTNDLRLTAQGLGRTVDGAPAEAGGRERAIEMYRRASRVRGADTSTRQAATKALDRLHVPHSSR